MPRCADPAGASHGPPGPGGLAAVLGTTGVAADLEAIAEVCTGGAQRSHSRRLLGPALGAPTPRHGAEAGTDGGAVLGPPATAGLIRWDPPGPSRRPGDGLAFGHVLGQGVAVALVGAVHNASALRHALGERGALFQGDAEAELLLHWMAQSRQRTLVNRLVEALEQVSGAFSFALVTADLCVAGRDVRGFWPLWLGGGDGRWAVASDQHLLRTARVGATREVGAGEVVVLEAVSAARSLRPWGVQPRAACALDWVLFGALDGTRDGLAAHALRRRLGRALAATAPADADLVASLPGTCPVAAMAFAERLGLPLDVGLVARPGDGGGLRAVGAAVAGRRVALVHEPSTPPHRLAVAVGGLREAGATRVHLRCIAPFPVAACRHGAGLGPLVEPGPDGEAALAVSTGADSARALHPADLGPAFEGAGDGRCEACCGGADPLPPSEVAPAAQLPLFSGRAAGAGSAARI